MSSTWGFVIPGLGMNAAEMPQVAGLVPLQNPGVGDMADFAESYTLEDVAKIHATTIQKSCRGDEDITIIGMSMGGMIASVIAINFRKLLPINTKFRFLVTSVNEESSPCITDHMLTEWYQAQPGNAGSFEKILKPFFGKAFRQHQSNQCESYYEFRSGGGNQQSPKAFLKQVSAVRSFRGTKYFSSLNSDEVTFFHGEDDEIMSAIHQRVLKNLQPKAIHSTVKGVGHMVNIEAPYLFHKNIPNFSRAERGL